jgi:hypothetical protein
MILYELYTVVPTVSETSTSSPSINLVDIRYYWMMRGAACVEFYSCL